jgi:sRNA-binding carbon storage regulator CsrA
MLVLRRRPHEALVFDGGLVLTLLSVIDRQAWIGLEGPAIADGVAIGVIAVSPEVVCLGVRSPAKVIRETAGLTLLELGDPKDDAVLLLNSALGDVIEFEGLRLAVTSVEDGRALLELTTSSLATPIGVSIVSVSVAEARIGVDAPDEIRVYRKEVWLEMQAANRGAAAEWSEADLATLATGSLVRSEDDHQ